MRRNEPNSAPTRRRCTILLIASLGLAGCFPPPPQVGDAPDPNCGIFYSCGSHGDSDFADQSGDSSESSSSGSSSSSTSTGGESATAGE